MKTLRSTDTINNSQSFVMTFDITTADLSSKYWFAFGFTEDDSFAGGDINTIDEFKQNIKSYLIIDNTNKAVKDKIDDDDDYSSVKTAYKIIKKKNPLEYDKNINFLGSRIRYIRLDEETSGFYQAIDPDNYDASIKCIITIGGELFAAQTELFGKEKYQIINDTYVGMDTDEFPLTSVFIYEDCKPIKKVYFIDDNYSSEIQFSKLNHNKFKLIVNPNDNISLSIFNSKTGAYEEIINSGLNKKLNGNYLYIALNQDSILSNCAVSFVSTETS